MGSRPLKVRDVGLGHFSREFQGPRCTGHGLENKAWVPGRQDPLDPLNSLFWKVGDVAANVARGWPQRDRLKYVALLATV